MRMNKTVMFSLTRLASLPQRQWNGPDWKPFPLAMVGYTTKIRTIAPTLKTFVQLFHIRGEMTTQSLMPHVHRWLELALFISLNFREMTLPPACIVTFHSVAGMQTTIQCMSLVIDPPEDLLPRRFCREEHRKRDKKNGNRCPFFTFSESTSAIKPPPRTQSQPTSKPSSKSRSVSALKHKESALPVEGSDAEPEASQASSSKRLTRGRIPSGTSVSAKPSRKATVSQSRNQLRGVAEDNEDIGMDDEEEAPPIVKSRRATRTTATAAAKPKARSRSQSVARQVLDLETEADEVAPRMTTSRTRSQTKEKITGEGEGGYQEEEESTVLKKSVRGRRVTRKPSQASKAKRLPEPDTELQESEEVDEAPARPTSRAKPKPSSVPASRKPSRTRAKAAVAVDTGGDETDDLDIMAPSIRPVVTTSQPIQTEPRPSERRPQTLLVEEKKASQEDSPEQDEINLTSSSSNEKGRGAITGTVEDLPPLLIPKRNTAPNQYKTPVVPTPDGDGYIEMKNTTQEPKMQSSSVPFPVMAGPQPPLQVNGKGIGKSKKASILKVVEISTDEEDVEEAPKHVEKLNIGAKAEKKPVKNAKLEETDSGRLSMEPSPTHNIEPFLQDSEDVAMAIVNGDGDQREAVISHDWVPNGAPPVTPTRTCAASQLTANGDTRTGDRNPVLFCPPLSKLPFLPLQNLTEAELDMTVEEWIRYQMEVEYDKFRRDGERELARFKKRADEVRKIIEEL